MSAECHKHGCDIVYPVGTWPVGICPECEHDADLDACRRELSDAQEELRKAREGWDGWQRNALEAENKLADAQARSIAERERADRLAEAVERLASMAGFEGAGYIGGDSFPERELTMRIKFAAEALAAFRAVSPGEAKP